MKICLYSEVLFHFGNDAHWCHFRVLNGHSCVNSFNFVVFEKLLMFKNLFVTF